MCVESFSCTCSHKRNTRHIQYHWMNSKNVKHLSKRRDIIILSPRPWTTNVFKISTQTFYQIIIVVSIRDYWSHLVSVSKNWWEYLFPDSFQNLGYKRCGNSLIYPIQTIKIYRSLRRVIPNKQFLIKETNYLLACSYSDKHVALLCINFMLSSSLT